MAKTNRTIDAPRREDEELLEPVPFAPCPHCGADPKKRQDVSGFGRRRLVLCTECAQEIPED